METLKTILWHISFWYLSLLSFSQRNRRVLSSLHASNVMHALNWICCFYWTPVSRVQWADRISTPRHILKVTILGLVCGSSFHLLELLVQNPQLSHLCQLWHPAENIWHTACSWYNILSLCQGYLASSTTPSITMTSSQDEINTSRQWEISQRIGISFIHLISAFLVFLESSSVLKRW
jgi:hypothetical protein